MRWYQRFFRRKLAEDHLDAELQFHLEQQTAAYVAAGMKPDEAGRRARLEFGGLEQVKENCRDVGAARFVETVIQDLRFGMRMLVKNTGLTVLVTALLAFGIGATTVVFSLFDAVFLRPLAVRRPAELVRVVQHAPKLPTYSVFAYAYYETLRDHSTTLAATFGETGGSHFPMADPEPTEEITVDGTTPEFFTVLGVRARHGRVLLPSDAKESPGMPPAVLSYGFWQRRFGGDPGIVNKRTLMINGHRFAIVGVMPRDFNGITVDTAPDVRIPLRAYVLLADFPKDRLYLELAGRLKPGVARPQAQAECLALWRSTMETYWRDDFRYSPQVISAELSRGMALEPLARGVSLLRDRYGAVLKLVMASVALLLIIVCTNVAGLLLERAAARQQEITVRLAVGATRFRLIRQLLAENLLLALVGTAGGLAVMAAGTPLALRMLPPIRAYPSPSIVPLAIDLDINWRVFLFLVVISLITVILFTLSPALVVSRSNLDALLRAARSSAGVRGRQTLIALQIALCTFLLVTAGLFVRTFEQLQQVNPGFNRDHIATFTIDLNAHQGQIATFLKTFTDRVRALPGVESVALSSLGVMRGTGTVTTVAPAGERTTRADFLNTTIANVSPEYFDTMGMHILAGRDFTPTDAPPPKAAGPIRTVVNKAFVQRFFPNVQPLGRFYGWAVPGDVAAQQYEIVGVVSDTKYRSLRAPIVPISYICKTALDNFVLNVRTRVRPAAIIAPVRKTLASLDPGLPIIEAHTMAEEIEISTGSERATAELALLFGGVAALLVGVGIYGLLAYAVTQRYREIGIRMALGAMRDNVLQLFVGQGLKLTFMGLAIGLLGSFAATRFFASLLYGVKGTDPLTFVTVSLLLIALALLASYFPARRATKVDPMVALRYE